MKVLMLTLLMVAVAAAIPVDVDSGDKSQLTLIDLDNEQSANENAEDVSRSKRFILKKIALVKAGALGVGALGLAGVVAAKSAFGGGGGFNSGPNQIPQGYGQAYDYNPAPTFTTSYPSTYVTSQTYVPPQPQYVAPQPSYQPSYQPNYQPSYGPQSLIGAPINSALQWKAGIANNIASGISNGFNGFASSASSAQPNYSYGAPPQVVPVPNKPLYVVCDHNN